jgi:hypothetical protein
MAKEPKTSFSLDDLDATKASAQAFEFEYITSSGDNSGVFLSVLGGQSEIVTTEVARLINDRRRKQASREVQQKIGVGSKVIEFETVESDIEFGQRLAAVRLVGWRGITEPWSVENALKLCRSNREIASQVTQQSDATANFISL